MAWHQARQGAGQERPAPRASNEPPRTAVLARSLGRRRATSQCGLVLALFLFTLFVWRGVPLVLDLTTWDDAAENGGCCLIPADPTQARDEDCEPQCQCAIGRVFYY